MVNLNLVSFVKKQGASFKRHAIIPALKAIVRYCTSVINGRSTISINESSWKQSAMEDFKVWLSEAPDQDSPAQVITPESCDLYTLMSQFTGLKQEIKMQNREQHRTLKNLQDFSDSYREVLDTFKQSSRDLALLEKTIREDCEKRSAAFFFEARDAMARCYSSSVELSSKRHFFSFCNRDDLKRSAKGQAMALKRFDNAFAFMHIEPLTVLGEPFDPETMKAVDERRVSGVEKGVVVDEVSGGYRRREAVLKYAEVVVSR